jgi:hypothetical protein
MDDLILSLEQLPHLRVEARAEDWVVQLDKPRGLQLEIIVPRRVLEWFVTARDAQGNELWSDWIDYQGYLSATEERPDQLGRQMIQDVERFILAAVTAEDFRVTTECTLKVLTRRRAEWQQRGVWEPVTLA